MKRIDIALSGLAIGGLIVAGAAVLSPIATDAQGLAGTPEQQATCSSTRAR